MKKRRHTRSWAVRLICLAAGVIMLTGCGGKGPAETTEAEKDYMEVYVEYAQSVLDANYHGDIDRYVAITGADSSQAAKLLDAHATNLAETVAEVYAIRLETLPAEVGDRLTEIAKDVYRRTSYKATEAESVNGTVYVTVEVLPLELMADTRPAVTEYTEKFNDRAKSGEFEHMTESEYENEYAKGILDVLEKAVASVGYSSALTRRLEIRYNQETGISYIESADLQAITDILVVR